VGGDLRDIRRCLAGAENHFGKSDPQLAVMIHVRHTEIREWQITQVSQGVRCAAAPVPHRFEERL
jgi:hypothetical protein